MTLKEVLIYEGMTSEEANERIKEARAELCRRIAEGENPMDFCEEEFGLEPDYLDDLLF